MNAEEEILSFLKLYMTKIISLNDLKCLLNNFNGEPYYFRLKQVLEFAEDIAIDVPKIWEYIGILMGYMSYDGTIPLAEYREPLLDLLQCNKAGAVMAYMLHHIAHNMVCKPSVLACLLKKF